MLIQGTSISVTYKRIEGIKKYITIMKKCSGNSLMKRQYSRFLMMHLLKSPELL